MPKVHIGQRIESLSLPGIAGDFDIGNLGGKRYMLSFHRFAACPFCNLRIHQIIQQHDRFSTNFQMIAIFDSPIDHLREHASQHHAPFPILADQHNVYYRKFGVERSLWRTLVGAFKRFPTVLYAIFAKGYFPNSFKGNITTMPLEILVNEHNLVEHVHYGRDEGDHLPIETIINFSHAKAPFDGTTRPTPISSSVA
ncbi:MAG: redoxin domain-containing protein [Thalassospira sp.]|uniref:redoxin domain-containing protein n=1 Tax=Thalassospira sp. TaxID=1912094 RepID=UPI0032EF903F